MDNQKQKPWMVLIKQFKEEERREKENPTYLGRLRVYLDEDVKQAARKAEEEAWKRREEKGYCFGSHS